MDGAKDFLKKNAILPRISFKDGLSHTVELSKSKMETITDADGKQVEGVKFMVKEDGDEKSFFTSSIALIEKLSQYDEGDTVTIKMKKLKGEDGYKTTYDVVGGQQGSPEEEPLPDETEDIPF